MKTKTIVLIKARSKTEIEKEAVRRNKGDSAKNTGRGHGILLALTLGASIHQ
jgi:hypothetical protein